MASRFYTEPANIMPGLQMLGQSLHRRAEYEKERVKTAKYERLKQEASQMIGKDPEEIARFVAKNPEARDIFKEAMGAQAESMLNTSRQYLINQQDPAELHIAEAERDIVEGRDPSGNIEMARAMMSTTERDRATKMHESVLAMFDPQGYKAYKSIQSGGIDGDVKVGAQVILEDGTIVQSTDKGPVVYDPTGRKVTGKAAADAVEQARAKEIENARKKAGEKKTATLEAEQELKGKVEAGVISQKEAAKISVKAFDRLEGINQNISNLDEGIRLLREEGASTGVIQKYIPSMRKASIKLDNLQGRLGLDVLRTTTFGALSAAELRFALDTAMPPKLEPEELAKWFEEKKEAQEKLADYIESAAIYLGTPGNTVSGWIQKKKTEREQRQPTGPTLQDFLQKASAANPGVSEQELTDYYNKKYGGL